MTFLNFNQFRKNAVALTCKIISQETKNPKTGMFVFSPNHKFLNIPRKIVKVSSDKIFFESEGNKSYLGIEKASEYSPTENGFMMTCEFIRLTYEFIP